MKLPFISSLTAPQRIVLCGLVAAAFCSFAPNQAMAESMFKLGLGSDLDTSLTAGGQVFLKIVRLIMFIIVIIGFVKFMKSKEWIDLLYVAGGLAGFGFSQKIAEGLFGFGGGPT